MNYKLQIKTDLQKPSLNQLHGLLVFVVNSLIFPITNFPARQLGEGRRKAITHEAGTDLEKTLER
jgi:hypothetical protein